MKPTAPGSYFSYYLPLRSTFYLLLFSDIFIQNPKNNFAAIYCYLFCSRLIYQSTTKLPHVCLPILRRRIPEGIENPFNTLGFEKLLFVCRRCLHRVAWFSYWFDNLGFISEGNTYRHCAASSLPLWRNTDVASSDINLSSPNHPKKNTTDRTSSIKSRGVINKSKHPSPMLFLPPRPRIFV